jgi:hypothetical protein
MRHSNDFQCIEVASTTLDNLGKKRRKNVFTSVIFDRSTESKILKKLLPITLNSVEYCSREHIFSVKMKFHNSIFRTHFCKAHIQQVFIQKYGLFCE